jgi:hypothetical protein
MSDTKMNEDGGALRVCPQKTMNEGPNWGPHPPRRTQRATALWVWMMYGKHNVDKYGLGNWLTFEEVKNYANDRWRNGMTSNQLVNLLGKYKSAFEKGPEVRIGGSVNNYSVHLWRAIR